MKHTNLIKIVITLLFVMLSLHVGSIDAGSPAAVKEKTISTYTKEKPKSDYTVDVTLNIIDVIAVDTDGKHITDLKPEDFELFEEGKKQKILGINYINHLDKILATDSNENNKNKKDSEPKGSRHFAFLVANLPKYDVKKDELLSTVVDFIKNELGEKDKVALYNISGSSINEFLPFTDDREKIFKNMGEYIESGMYKKNRFVRPDQVEITSQLRNVIVGEGGMSVPHDVLVMQSISSEQGIIYKNVSNILALLAESMRHIRGRKNIILLSEGLYPGSISSMTYKNLQEKVSNSFNSFNLSMYTLDVGHAEKRAGTENARTTVLRDLSGETGGTFLRGAGLDDNALSAKLKEVNYQTACYYELSYAPGPDQAPGKLYEIEVRTHKNHAKLKHRKGIFIPKRFDQMKNDEKILYITSTASGSSLYNEMPICTDVRFFPADKDETKTWFSIEVPFPEVFQYQDNAPGCHALVAIVVSNMNEKEVSKTHKVLSFSLKKGTKISAEQKLRFSGLTSLPPGDYDIQFFIGNYLTGKMASDIQRINVPDYTGSRFALGSILNASNNTNVLSLNEYSSLPGFEKKKPDKKHPLFLDGNLLVHQLLTVEKSKDIRKMFITLRGLSIEEIRKFNSRVIRWSVSEVKNDEETLLFENVNAELLQIIPQESGSFNLMFNLNFHSLPVGKYILKATFQPKLKEIITSTMPIEIIVRKKTSGRKFIF